MDKESQEYKEGCVSYKEWGRDYIYRLVKLCRDVGSGVNAKWGPKYEYIKDGLRVYVDDYGNYATVNYGGIQVASTHFCDQYILKGEWMQVADKLLMIEPSCLGAGI